MESPFNIVGAIFGFIFVAAGLGFVGYSIASLWRGLASRSWHPVQGRIVKSEVVFGSKRDAEGQSTYRPGIEYEYEVLGRSHTGTRVSFGIIDKRTPLAASRIVRRYPLGKEVTLFHHPFHPDRAVLEVGPAGGYLSTFIVGSLVALFGAFFAHITYWGFEEGLARLGVEFSEDLLRRVIGIGAAGMGSLFVVLGLVMNARAWRARRWPTVQGTIISSRINSETTSSSSSVTTVTSQRMYYPEIVYRYEIDGAQYVSNRIRLVESSSTSGKQAERDVARYTEGSVVNVLCNPSNPEDAFLEAKGGGGGCIFAAAGLFFAIVGSLLLAFG